MANLTQMLVIYSNLLQKRVKDNTVLVTTVLELLILYP